MLLPAQGSNLGFADQDRASLMRSVVQLALALHVRNTLIDAEAERARICALGDLVVLRCDRIASVLIVVQTRGVGLGTECHVIFGVLSPDEVRAVVIMEWSVLSGQSSGWCCG